MPFRSIRRHWTAFGEILQNTKGREKGQSLLITRGGKRLLLDYRKLLKAVRVEAVGHSDNVTFSKGIRPKFIGEGVHAQVFVLSPLEEKPLKQRSGKKSLHRPSVVLKVYRASIPETARPDGFTQFVGETAIYNYLKKQRGVRFVVRPLSYYFVSNKLTVRKFINAPTLEELRECLVPKMIRRKPLSLALPDRQIEEFVSRNRITREELDLVFRQACFALSDGLRVNYNVNQKIPITPDTGIKNFFVLGRDPEGKLIISVIDQGRKHVEGTSELLAQHIAFMA